MSAHRDDDSHTPAIESKLQAHIGRQLRQLYDQVAFEPVPDRFKALLDQLEAQEAKIEEEESIPDPVSSETQTSGATQ